MSDNLNTENEGMDSNEEQSYWNWSVSGSNSWIWGFVFILLGGLLLLKNFFPGIPVVVHAGNWWAVLLLVPGVNMIGRGWQDFRRSGRLWGPLLWGTLLVAFAVSQLLTYSVSVYIWPVLLILGGLVLLFGGNRG